MSLLFDGVSWNEPVYAEVEVKRRLVRGWNCTVAVPCARRATSWAGPSRWPASVPPSGPFSEA